MAPSDAPPSISALREKNTLKAQAEWARLLGHATASPADKYLAVSGPPTRRPRKLLTMSTSHSRKQLAAVAQVLCCAGPFGGYWMKMSAAYRNREGLITHCRWHNHPPWPAQTVSHILGGCSTFRPWLRQVWPDDLPLPAHHSEWAKENLLPVIRRWLKITGHLDRPTPRTSGAIRLAFAGMELDGHPTDNDLDLNTLREYVRRALGPWTLETDTAFLDFRSVSNQPPEPTPPPSSP